MVDGPPFLVLPALRSYSESDPPSKAYVAKVKSDGPRAWLPWVDREIELNSTEEPPWYTAERERQWRAFVDKYEPIAVDDDGRRPPALPDFKASG